MIEARRKAKGCHMAARESVERVLSPLCSIEGVVRQPGCAVMCNVMNTHTHTHTHTSLIPHREDPYE